MYTLALAPQVFRDKARRAAGRGPTRKRRNAGSGNLGRQPHKLLNVGARPLLRGNGVAAPLCRRLHGGRRALFARKSDSSASVYINQCLP